MNRKELLTQFEHNMMVIGKEMHEHQLSISKYSPAQNHVLLIIGLRGSLRVKELAEILHVTSGAITQHIEVLEKAGLLIRRINSKNRREVMVEITPKGEHTFKEIRSAKLETLNDLFSILDDDELATLTKLIEKISSRYTLDKE